MCGDCMLLVINDLEELDFRKLMDVYEQWNVENGAFLYPQESENLQLLFAEQDFYHFLREFFQVQNARYFIWQEAGRYVSALRLEPYCDGYLLEALETTPASRRNGFATLLIQAVISYMAAFGKTRIYAHVAKTNEASLLTHRKCGFAATAEDAVFIDGSYHTDHFTLLYDLL